MRNTIGIYSITNKVDSKIYIGQSICMEKRWMNHKIELRNNYHCNNHLQNAWNKYGEDNFEFKLLIECDELELSELELKYIAEAKSTDSNFGYNLTSGGEGGRLSEETKQKIRESKLGEKNPMFGKKHTNETKDKWKESRVILTGSDSYNYGRKKPNASSQYLGVTQRKNNRWETSIKYSKGMIYIGRFCSEIEAAKAYDEASIKYYGDKAVLNFQ